jgi:hypothetical protein
MPNSECLRRFACNYSTTAGCRLAAVVSHSDACSGRLATLRAIEGSEFFRSRTATSKPTLTPSRPRLTLMLTVSCEATPAASAVSGLRAMGPLPLQRGEEGELRSQAFSTHYPHASCNLIFKSTWDLTGLQVHQQLPSHTVRLSHQCVQHPSP